MTLMTQREKALLNDNEDLAFLVMQHGLRYDTALRIAALDRLTAALETLNRKINDAVCDITTAISRLED